MISGEDLSYYFCLFLCVLLGFGLVNDFCEICGSLPYVIANLGWWFRGQVWICIIWLDFVVVFHSWCKTAEAKFDWEPRWSPTVVMNNGASDCYLITLLRLLLHGFLNLAKEKEEFQKGLEHFHFVFSSYSRGLRIIFLIVGNLCSGETARDENGQKETKKGN